MKFLPLVWRNLMRRKIRTFITTMTIVVAFILFGALMAIRAAFSLGVDVAGADRLMMIHKVSIINPLPQSYGDRIRSTEGVTLLTYANWFGGYFREPTNFVQSMAVDPETWLQMYPEFEVPEAQKKTWLGDRTGAIIGADLAAKWGWKVGDRVPLLAPIYQRVHNGPWEFTIDGIYDSDKQGVDKTQFFFHWAYLNEVMEKIPDLKGQVGWYVFRVADPSTSDQLAKTIDAMFANSPAARVGNDCGARWRPRTVDLMGVHHHRRRSDRRLPSDLPPTAARPRARRAARACARDRHGADPRRAGEPHEDRRRAAKDVDL
jgi:putative ABC transport system permease protein